MLLFLSCSNVLCLIPSCSSCRKYSVCCSSVERYWSYRTVLSIVRLLLSLWAIITYFTPIILKLLWHLRVIMNAVMRKFTIHWGDFKLKNKRLFRTWGECLVKQAYRARVWLTFKFIVLIDLTFPKHQLNYTCWSISNTWISKYTSSTTYRRVNSITCRVTLKPEVVYD